MYSVVVFNGCSETFRKQFKYWLFMKNSIHFHVVKNVIYLKEIFAYLFRKS